MAAVLLLACQGWPWIGLHGKEGMHGAAAAGKFLARLDERQIEAQSYQWTLQGKVVGEAGPHRGYGAFISLSDDGQTMATGAGYPERTGYIQVFRWQDASINASWTGAGAWVQLGKDFNGTHVHLSKNGLVVAIGKRGESDRGWVTIYLWNQSRFEWVQKGRYIDGDTPLSETGRRSGEVAISSLGDVVAIGEKSLIDSNDNVQLAPCESCRHVGTVRVFRWSEEGAEWLQFGATIHGEAAVDYFGRSISINGKGNIVALAEENGRSLVRLFKWEASESGDDASLYSWTKMGDDITGEDGESRADSSVILSESGATVAIADNVNSSDNAHAEGRVRIFQWSNSAQSWTMKGDAIVTEHIDDSSGERSAAKPSISMDSSGVLVSVGSPSGPRDTGHVRSFRWNATKTAWEEMGAMHVGGYGAIEGEVDNGRAGASVQLVNGMNGVFVAVGEPGNGNGHVRVFTLAAWPAPQPPAPQPADGRRALAHAATKLSVFNMGSKAKPYWLDSGQPEPLLEWTEDGTSMQLLGETFDTPDRRYQVRTQPSLAPSCRTHTRPTPSQSPPPPPRAHTARRTAHSGSRALSSW